MIKNFNDWVNESTTYSTGIGSDNYVYSTKINNDFYNKCHKILTSEIFKKTKMSVIFTTEQNEGRTVEPYLENVEIDLCADCKKRILNANVLYGRGAMGYNEYYFIN